MADPDANPDTPLAVAVVTDGHPHDVPGFQRALAAVGGVTFYPQDLATFAVDPADRRGEYDAVVFYSFHGRSPYVEIPGDAETAVRELAATGTGIVVLHHGLAAFPEWSFWDDVVGIDDRDLDFEHDVDLEYRIAAEHPITAGLSDWTMTDETYLMPEPAGTVLMTVDHPASMEAIAWTRRQEEARVFCYQSGHDGEAFGTEQFRTVLGRGVEWSAGAV